MFSALPEAWSIADRTPGDLAHRVQQAVVVNQAVVTGAGDINSGSIELARIGFAFVTQDFHLCRLNDGGRPVWSLEAECRLHLTIPLCRMRRVPAVRRAPLQHLSARGK